MQAIVQSWLQQQCLPLMRMSFWFPFPVQYTPFETVQVSCHGFRFVTVPFAEATTLLTTRKPPRGLTGQQKILCNLLLFSRDPLYCSERTTESEPGNKPCFPQNDNQQKKILPQTLVIISTMHYSLAYITDTYTYCLYEVPIRFMTPLSITNTTVIQ